MSNLETHAERELRAAGLFDEDSDYEGMLADATMRLIKVFADEGHSGCSASIAISLFEKLARFEPLSPLTGEDNEWNDVFFGEQDGILYQNKRCGRVFKDDNGAYDVEGRIFREPNGACFTSKDSRVPVTFPYVPMTEYVDVNTEKEKEGR